MGIKLVLFQNCSMRMLLKIKDLSNHLVTKLNLSPDYVSHIWEGFWLLTLSL